MHIGVNIDTSAKIQLITTQSMPEGMSEHLKIDVSISMIKKLTFLNPPFNAFSFKSKSFCLCPHTFLKCNISLFKIIKYSKCYKVKLNSCHLTRREGGKGNFPGYRNFKRDY